MTVATWTEHVLAEHGELAGEETPIRHTIEFPDVVCFDAGFAVNGRENFYRRVPASPNFYYKVCVEFDADRRGTVVTAYMSNQIGNGEEAKWPSL